MPTVQQQVVDLARRYGETWTSQKINQVATQIQRGQRTLIGVNNDVATRLGRPAAALPGVAGPNTRPVPPGGKNPVTADATEKEADGFDAESSASIQNTLKNYGLEELVPMVDAWVREGRSWAEIEGMLMDPSSQAGAVVDRKYPELRLRSEAGRTPMTIGQIRQYKDTARSLMRAAGMPEGFYDQPADFTKLIVSDISPGELETRIVNGFQAAMSAPAEVRNELDRLYGVGSGALAAFFIDPDRALSTIQRNFAAAQIGGASKQSGFGNLSTAEAETIATTGQSFDQAGQKFGALVGARELFNPLDQGEDVITRDEQLAAGFTNSEAARLRIENRARRRVGVFQAGGSVAATRGSGFGGLSTSSDA